MNAYQPQYLSAAWRWRQEFDDAKSTMQKMFVFAKELIALHPVFKELRLENAKPRLRDATTMPVGWPRSYTSRRGQVTLLSKSGRGAMVGFHAGTKESPTANGYVIVRMPAPEATDFDLWGRILTMVNDTWAPDEAEIVGQPNDTPGKTS